MKIIKFLAITTVFIVQTVPIEFSSTQNSILQSGLSRISFIQSAHAGVGDSMDHMWKSLGGVSSSTSAGSYKSQSAGYWTLGSYYARAKVKTLSPFNAQMPSLKVGSCGNIDIFKGAFSMIDVSQMQELLQAIAANAMTFAFQLALETISPVIAEKVEEIQGWLQKMNELNINSCETAQMMVGAAAPRHERASQLICEKAGHTKGGLADHTAAKHGCGKGGEKNEVMSKTGDANKSPVEDINITWNALKDKKFFGDDEDKDEKLKIDNGDLRELFMTLSGTIIIQAAKNDTDEPKYIYKGAKADYGKVIKAFMDGGKIDIISCDEKKKCLNPNTREITIKKENAFRQRTEKMLKEIIEKIKNDEKLGTTEAGLVEMIENAQIPIYKVLIVYAAYSGAGEVFELPVYADAIALQVLYTYLDDVLRKVGESIDGLVISTEDQLNKMKQNISTARQALYQREMKTHQNYNAIMTMVQKTVFIENIIAQEQASSAADLLTRIGAM
ncbi:MAG: conjugal transfer protein TraH [Proteobacteria bacterium]|nr:conjugal transfer protein TraH [Pseudomonadota bacterium]